MELTIIKLKPNTRLTGQKIQPKPKLILPTNFPIFRLCNCGPHSMAVGPRPHPLTNVAFFSTLRQGGIQIKGKSKTSLSNSVQVTQYVILWKNV